MRNKTLLGKTLALALAALLTCGTFAADYAVAQAEELVEETEEEIKEEAEEEEESEEKDEEEAEAEESEEEAEEEAEAEDVDEEGGIMLFATNDEEYVAYIGETGYVTLDDAIKASKNGAEGDIRVVADATIFERYITGNVVISAQGHIITIANRGFRTEDDRFLIQSGASLTLMNGRFVFEAWDEYGATDGQQSLVISGTLNVKSCAVTMNEGAYAYLDSKGEINLQSCAMNFTNSRYTALMCDGKPNININNGGVLIINGGERKNRAITAANIVVNKGGNLIVTNSDGVRASNLTINEGGTAQICENISGIILYGDTLTVEAGGALYANNNTDRALYTRDGASTILLKEGSVAEFANNGKTTASGQLGADYEAQKAAVTIGLKEKKTTTTGDTFTIEDGANVSFHDNYGRAITNFGTAYIGNTTSIRDNGKRDVALGGGILNAGLLTVADNAAVLNNTARVAGDDIYSYGDNTEGFRNMMEEPTVSVGTAFDGYLTVCEHEIDNWYVDAADARWSDENVAKAVVAEKTNVGGAALKAAHGAPQAVTPAPTPAPATQVLGAARTAETPVAEEGVLGVARAPKTADSSMAVVWLLMMGAAVAGTTVLIKKNKETV